MTKGTRSLWILVGATAMAVGVWLPAPAWVFHPNDRIPSHSPLVGRLEVELPEGRAMGTAFLVDECGILSNFHVVFGPWYVTALRPPSRDFPGTFTLTELVLPDGTHPTALATPVIWGDYLGPDRQLRRMAEDWAYLVLDRCLGREHGYFELQGPPADDWPLPSDGFVSIGYSSDRQMQDPRCSVGGAGLTVEGGGWRHDCALLPGDSGGPIVRSGTRTVIALGAGYSAHLGQRTCPLDGGSADGIAGSRWASPCVNLAVPLSWPVIDRIRNASAAVALQRELPRFGIDAGPLGFIDDPRLTAAIKRVQRELGWTAIGEPSRTLLKFLQLARPGA